MHHKPVDAVGMIQLNKIGENPIYQKAVRAQQLDLAKTFEEILENEEKAKNEKIGSKLEHRDMELENQDKDLQRINVIQKNMKKSIALAERQKSQTQLYKDQEK